MSKQGTIETDCDQQVTLLIKNPSKHDDAFTLSVSLSSSLADIQRKLAEEYEGKPSPSSQTLIYAGKVLKDVNMTVREIIKQPSEPDVPHSMHLVIRAPVVKPASSTGLNISSTQPVQGSRSVAPTSSRPAPALAATAAATSIPSAPPAAAVASSTQPIASSSGSLQEPAGTSPSPPDPAPASIATSTNSSAHMFEFGTGLHGTGDFGTSAGSIVTDFPATSTAMPYPYMFFNPMNFNAMSVSPVMNNQVIATAYQAAYSAALQSMRQQMQVQAGTAAAGAASSSSAAATAGAPPGAPHVLPLTAPLTPAVLYYPAAYQQAAAAAAMAAAAAAAQQGQQASGMPPAAAQFAVPAPFAVPVMGMPAHLATHPVAAQQAAAAAGNAAAPAGRIGLRQRFPGGFNLVRLQAGINQAAARQDQQAAAAAQPGGVHAHPHGQRRYRTRTITFRISMRTLLQMLVFGMVLYQHCTWPRLCILLAGSVILYATALWAPFRQFILSLAMPLRPEQLAEVQRRRQQQQQAAIQQQQQQQQLGPAAAVAAVAADVAAAEGQQQADAAQQQQQDEAEGAAGAVPLEAAQAPAGAATPPAGGVAVQPAVPAWLQQGIVREILTVLVSFVTSLLPAWNQNPEDAAVFAAAQEMMVREAQEQQQQQQDAARANGGVAGDAARAAAAPAP